MSFSVAPSPTPYPSPSNGVVDSWHCTNAAPVVTAVPAPPLGAQTNQIYIPSYDCAVTHWSETREFPVSVVPAPAGTPAAAGYNVSDNNYGSWDDHFVDVSVQAVFTVALAVIIIGLLVHWGKAAVFGRDPSE